MKKNLTQAFSIATIALVIVSCGGQNETKEASKSNDAIAQKQAAMMVVHDSVMPWMDAIHSLKDSIEKNFSLDSNQVAANAHKNLEEAGTEMMDWMRNYADNYMILDGRAATPELMDTLNQLHVEIETVGSQMASSIEEARAMLNTEADE